MSNTREDQPSLLTRGVMIRGASLCAVAWKKLLRPNSCLISTTVLMKSSRLNRAVQAARSKGAKMTR